MSSPFGSITATCSPGATPSESNQPATRSDSACSAANVADSPSVVSIQVASGRRAACSASTAGSTQRSVSSSPEYMRAPPVCGPMVRRPR